jgi:hypothetical protein
MLFVQIIIVYSENHTKNINCRGKCEISYVATFCMLIGNCVLVKVKLIQQTVTRIPTPVTFHRGTGSNGFHTLG